MKLLAHERKTGRERGRDKAAVSYELNWRYLVRSRQGRVVAERPSPNATSQTYCGFISISLSRSRVSPLLYFNTSITTLHYALESGEHFAGMRIRITGNNIIHRVQLDQRDLRCYLFAFLPYVRAHKNVLLEEFGVL